MATVQPGAVPGAGLKSPDCVVFQLPVHPGGGVKVIEDTMAGAATDAESATLPATTITLILRLTNPASAELASFNSWRESPAEPNRFDAVATLAAAPLTGNRFQPWDPRPGGGLYLAAKLKPRWRATS